MCPAWHQPALRLVVAVCSVLPTTIFSLKTSSPQQLFNRPFRLTNALPFSNSMLVSVTSAIPPLLLCVFPQCQYFVFTRPTTWTHRSFEVMFCQKKKESPRAHSAPGFGSYTASYVRFSVPYSLVLCSFVFGNARLLGHRESKT